MRISGDRGHKCLVFNSDLCCIYPEIIVLHDYIVKLFSLLYQYCAFTFVYIQVSILSLCITLNLQNKSFNIFGYIVLLVLLNCFS